MIDYDISLASPHSLKGTRERVIVKKSSICVAHVLMLCILQNCIIEAVTGFETHFYEEFPPGADPRGAVFPQI